MSSRENDAPSTALAVDFTPGSIFARGDGISFDILGSLPKPKNGNRSILLIVDLFSRHAEQYALSAEENTAKRCASKLANGYLTRLGCPKLWRSDPGVEFAQAAKLVYEKLGLTSHFHPHANSSVETESYSMPNVIVSSRQNDWNEYLVHVVYAHNNHICRAMGLAPNEVHIGRYPRLPATLRSSEKKIRGAQHSEHD